MFSPQILSDLESETLSEFSPQQQWRLNNLIELARERRAAAAAGNVRRARWIEQVASVYARASAAELRPVIKMAG